MLGHRRIFVPVDSIFIDHCSLHFALGSLWPQMAKGPGKVCVPSNKPDGNVDEVFTVQGALPVFTLAKTFVSLKGSPPGHLLT